MEFALDMEYIVVKNEQGKVVLFEHDDITALIYTSLHYMGKTDRLLSLNLADKVMYRLKIMRRSDNHFEVRELEQMIKFVLSECGYAEANQYVSSLSEKMFAE
ncbi:MAG: hypothetical protein N2662_06810 [Bacteroidales bacterium]|nr:hypothetical protein [Bacteroidales bacterium]